MLNEKITLVKGFQTSVNIAYDLHNDRKIQNFIPTMSSIEVIDDILQSVSTNTSHRARFLVGAYGRGKSHIVLVMLSLLFRKEKELFNQLLKKIESTNISLYEHLLQYLNSDKNLLPVIVSGNSASLTQSFLNALQQTLRNEGLEDIMPTTNFLAVENTVSKWKKEYPETYKKFSEILNEDIGSFLISIKEFDVSAYEKFKSVYPQLTSGSEFNPFIGFDVIELYEKVLDALICKGFSGIYIVYDEFSKYLEASISTASVSDTKLLQDFAERCDRSGDKQMHLMLISHKDISNYIDNSLAKEKVDGWRGVSGRFLQMDLHNNFSQMYEIISTVIKKDITFWHSYTNKNKPLFTTLQEQALAMGVLEKENTKLAIEGCYPLHFLSTFILPRLSEKVAQNERTLFTFLSSKQKHTLNSFLDNVDEKDFPLLTPDYLYNYFEPLFKKEHYSSEIAKIYKLTNKVIQKVELNSLGVKIIKTIALCYIVEQFEKLPPTYATIVNAFTDSVADISEIRNTLEKLIEKDCIVYLKQSNGYLRIKETSGFDIQKEVSILIEKNKETLQVKNILNETIFENYLYPVAYNDEMEIVRYFDFKFITATEFLNTSDWSNKIESSSATGIVYGIIPESESEIVLVEEAILTKKYEHKQVLFILPRSFIAIKKICYEYALMQQLKERFADDESVSDECDIYLEDLGEVVNSFISRYIRPELKQANYIYFSKKLNIRRKAQISAKLSEICYSIYTNTPVINNESINKNILPTVAIKSRNRVLTGLLENKLSPNLGLFGTGQEISFMRSTLIQTGILKEENGKAYLDLYTCDEAIAKMLKAITEFILSTAGRGKSFAELYSILIESNYGYGLKKGVIPIYIAVALHAVKQNIVIKFKNEELKTTVDLLNSINESPEKYVLYLENWDREKSKYINELSFIFEDDVLEKEKVFNNFNFIVSAMSRWYVGLPRYTKELKIVYRGIGNTQKVTPLASQHIKFLSSLKLGNLNAREFLFEKAHKIYGQEKFTLSVVSNIKDAKEFFDNAKKDLIKSLIGDVKTIFSAKQNQATLCSLIQDWYEQLAPTTAKHLFSNGENKLLTLMSSITNDEKTFVERLVKVVTGLRVDDWNDNSITEFLETLTQMKKTIENFNSQDQAEIHNSNIYTIAFASKNGESVEKTFQKIECDGKAKLLYNSISNELEEMGQSISEQEKRQVLMSLIEKMC